MPAGRGYKQAERLLRLVRTLMVRRTGITLEELVEKFEVDKRTIYRDISLLEQAGFPIVRSRSADRLAYKLPSDFQRTPPPTFTLPELMALRLSKNQLRYLEGTPFHQDYSSIFNKIESILPGTADNQLELFEKALFVHPEAPKIHKGMDKIIAVIEESLRGWKAAKFTYLSRNRTRPKEYLIHPYGLVSYKRGLYLLAFVPEYREVRCFAVDSRVKGIDLTDEDYLVPDDFSIENYTQSAFGIISGPPEEVKVEFSKDVAANVSERIWHQSQKIEKKKDGKVVIAMNVAGSPELTAWVLSYGIHAKVLKPKWLKDDVKNELKQALKKYP